MCKESEKTGSPEDRIKAKEANGFRSLLLLYNLRHCCKERRIKNISSGLPVFSDFRTRSYSLFAFIFGFMLALTW